MSDDKPQNQSTERGQPLFTVIKSVAAAMIGVQSSKNREEDFARGKPGTYIAIGVVATVLFILAIWGVVKLVSSLVIPQ